MSSLDTAKCQKCGKVVPSGASRTYNLAIQNSVSRNTGLSNRDTIVLCLSCDNSRRTNLVEFMRQS
jgi:hypothetical protein